MRGDGGGGATSWLDGSYAGREVHASTAPGAQDSGRAGSSSTGYAYNAFAIVLVGRSGGRDWQLRHAGNGSQPAWQLVSDDAALVQRLSAGGLVERIDPLGYPSPAITEVRLPVLAYSARDGQLHYREDAGSAWVPPPDRFRFELDTLVAVADLNDQVNR